MSKQTAQQPIKTAQTNQTPFELFKAAASVIFAVPKSSLQKPTKKSVKK
jgi:hypothetical protein